MVCGDEELASHIEGFDFEQQCLLVDQNQKIKLVTENNSGDKKMDEVWRAFSVGGAGQPNLLPTKIRVSSIDTSCQGNPFWQHLRLWKLLNFDTSAHVLL
jgi:hypothetical protein